MAKTKVIEEYTLISADEVKGLLEEVKVAVKAAKVIKAPKRAVTRDIKVPFPGILLTTKTKVTPAIDAAIRQIQTYLNIPVTGVYDNSLASQVSYWQATHKDIKGNLLEIDGKVGIMTWEAMFGSQTVTVSVPILNDVVRLALEIALKEEGVSENPPGSNRGKKVDEYLITAGVKVPNPWCMAYVYWCYVQAAKKLGVGVPIPRTALVATLYNWAKKNGKLVTTPQVGDLFCVPGGPNGHQHVGFVVGISNSANSYIVTVEGNTNTGGSREGIEVRRRERKVGSLSFIRVA